MITFLLNKLGRDKSPERMKKTGIIPQYKIITGEELLSALRAKIIEEALEVTQAHDKQDMIAELADLAEVVESLKRYYCITDQEVAAEKALRYEQRGGFEQGVFMESISMDDDNERVAHFRASPEKYPEK